MLLVEQKSTGRDLPGAEQQALDYIHGLTEAELPRFVLVSDFRTFCRRTCPTTAPPPSPWQSAAKLVYNTFPLPAAADLSRLDPLAHAVLDARAAHPGATLADLYDPDLMPADLRRAHQALDRAVDRLYRPAGFASDRERVEHLFARYEAMAAPLLTRPARRRRA